MQVRNYQKELEKIIEQIQKEGRVPSLLLHSCCAPCSSYVLSYLSEYFRITVLYYNPNKGENYHSQPTCSLVKDKYEPMTSFHYGDLDKKPYSKLTHCPGCAPMPRKDKIDELNNKSRKH